MISNRLWTRVTVGEPDECWEWHGCKNNKGYGWIWCPETNRVEGTHRVAWMIENGPIPKGMCVCHTCDNPACCNPGHLFLGTYSANTQDMLNKGRGTYPIGTTNKMAKLDDDKVRCILSSDLDGKVLAKIYGVKFSTIWHILKRKTWKHVDVPERDTV